MRLQIVCLVLLLGLGFTPAPAAEVKPLTLQAAREIALRQHPRISMAELQALAARQVVSEVRSAFFPSVAFSATAVGTTDQNTRIAAGALNNPAIYERQADGLMFSQLITDFGRTAHLTKTTQFRARAEDKNAEATRDQILIAVDVAFFDALKAQAVLLVSTQTLATRQMLLEQVSLLASNKLKSELDVSFARVAREEGRLLVAKAENSVQASFAALTTLLGYREEHTFVLAQETTAGPTLPSESAQVVELALSQRPDLARLRYDREAATQFTKAERALRYPSVNAFGAGGLIPVRDDQTFNRDYAAAGINLNFPLFTGGLLTARQREAELRARAAEERVRDAENDVIREVHVVSLNTQYAVERLSLTAKYLQSSSQAYELAQARYKLGTSSIVELSQAQLSLTEAEISHTGAQFDLQIQRALLNYTVGGKP